MNKELFLNLYNQGLSDRQIAAELNSTPNKVANYRKRNLHLCPNKPNDSYMLTAEELQILIGTLLGDSNIRYVYSKCRYPMLNFTHCSLQKEWAEWKYNKLINLNSSFSVHKKKSGFLKEPTDTYQFTGKNLKCLKFIHDIFYVNNHKVIPISFLNTYMTELSLYCLMMDDGYYDKKTNSFGLCTNCFSKENLCDFCNLLKNKFNLHFTIKKDNSLYLKHKSNTIMFDLLNKYNECKSMEYKCSH